MHATVERITRLKDRRNAAAVFADLHEAIRHQRVCHLMTDGSFLDCRDLGLNMVRAIYDVDAIVQEMHRDRERFTSGRNRGAVLCEEGILIPDRCAFLWAQLEGEHDESEWLWAEQVVFVDPARFADQGDDGWVIHIYSRDTIIKTDRASHYGPKAQEWTCRRVIVNATHWSVEHSVNAFRGVDQAELPKSDRDLFVLIHNTVLAVCAEMSTAPQIEIATHPQYEAMNSGRQRGRLGIIPPMQRVLKLDRTLYAPHAASTATGREVRPHFRRGTFRTYRSERFVNMQGKMGPVRATVVHADKNYGPTLPVYQVID